ncbi:MAG: ABC transporter permease subunit [Anaerolineae bacterium]|nr:ABC transporter permease subunit [Anaerolineae bacterium]
MCYYLSWSSGSCRLGYALSGAALVEIVFAWPGVGRLTLDSVLKRDYPVLMGIYLVIAISVMAAILITDIVYAFIDPRIRYQS